MNDSDLDVARTVIRDNVLADNAVGGVSHFTFGNTDLNVIQGNHLSGASGFGLRTADSEGQLVVQNTVFGEPIEISEDDQYGPVIESGPAPNNAWANFRLE